MHPKTGTEGYRIGLEVFHQLHCINLLRQIVHKDYYTALGNGNFAGGEKELQMHASMYSFSYHPICKANSCLDHMNMHLSV